MPKPAERTPPGDNVALGRLVTRLEELRASAGNGRPVPFRELATRANVSAAALNKAVNGQAVPTRETVWGFVVGCGSDPAAYLDLREEARAEADRLKSVDPAPTPADQSGDEADNDSKDSRARDEAVTFEPPRAQGRRPRPNSPGWTKLQLIGGIAAAVLVVVITVVVVLEIVGWGVNSPAPHGPIGNPIAAPGNVVLPTGGADAYALVSRPSQHCTYYRHLVDHAEVGSSYECATNASLNTYHVWIICSGSPTPLLGPSVPKGMPSTRDCPASTRPSTGGFARDS